MPDAAPTTALPVPNGSADEAWRETSMLYFRAAVERLYWQDIAVMHLRVTNCGNIPPRCIPSRQVVASFRRGAFSGARRWQNAREMRSPASDSGKISPRCVFGLSAMAVFRRGAFSGVQSWRDYAVVRFRAAIRGGFFASCVPEGASDGKSAPSWQHIAAVHPKRAGFGKTCAPCIRKAPQTAVGGYTARRSCHEGALFAARAPQIMHGARILPAFWQEHVQK